MYRARLGNPLHVLGLMLALQLVLGASAVGGVGLTCELILERPDLLPLACTTTLLCLLLPWLLGLGQALFVLRREGIHRDAAWLQAMVDMQCWAMRAEAQADPQKQAFFNRYGWPVLGLGLNLPLIFELAGSARHNVVVFIAPPMLLGINVLMLPMGRLLGYLLALRLFERRSGRPLRAAHEDALNERRRRLWFSRWVCSKVPLAAPSAELGNRTQRREARRSGRQ